MKFQELCQELLNNEEFVSHFNRLTNNKLCVPRTQLEIMIDEACNYTQGEEAIPEFVDWVYTLVWVPSLDRRIKHDYNMSF